MAELTLHTAFRRQCATSVNIRCRVSFMYIQCAYTMVLTVLLISWFIFGSVCGCHECFSWRGSLLFFGWSLSSLWSFAVGVSLTSAALIPVDTYDVGRVSCSQLPVCLVKPCWLPEIIVQLVHNIFCAFWQRTTGWPQCWNIVMTVWKWCNDLLWLKYFLLENGSR